MVSSALADNAAVRVAAAYAGRVAHIETIGVMYNKKDEVGSGSGLLLGNRLILTNNHVIPSANIYQELAIHVRLKSRLSRPRAVISVQRDEVRDLALLTLASTVDDANRSACPMPVIKIPELAPMGTTVYVLGFPLNEDLGITSGVISSHSANAGRWRTDNLITFGNSGGPVFDGKGSLVGLAVGGIGSFIIGGEKRDVDGVNFIIPAIAIFDSPLWPTISAIPDPLRCWRDVPDGKEVALADAPDVLQPQTLTRTYTVSQTKDDHPVTFAPHGRVYDHRFDAEPGYMVTGCNFVAASANHAGDVTCNVGPGGANAVFNFRLQSGPAVDQWRGWWTGTITLDQRRQP